LNCSTSTGSRFRGAAWVTTDTIKEWWYYVVTGLMDMDGPLATYGRLDRLFEALPQTPMEIDDVHLGSPDEPMFKTLRRAAEVESGPVAFAKLSVNGGFMIEHAIVYRMLPNPIPTRLQAVRANFDRYLKQLEAAV
jgi:hypothetical protein